MALLATLIFLLAMNRSGLLLTVFFALTVIHYGIRRLSLGHVFAFIAVFMGLFIPFSYSRLTDEQKKVLARLDPLMVSGYMLKIPYVYMANNYWNLDYALNPENYQAGHPTTYGYTTFSGVLDLVYIPGAGILGTEIRESGGFEDMFHKQSVKSRGLNTFTYQWGLYKDFGLAGVLLIPFVVGILIGVFHRRMREQPDVFNIAVYSYLAFFVAFNWFTAMWELLNFVYGFIFVVTGCFLCRKLTLGPVAKSASEPSASPVR
jgi:oligosaccharide repeat unit polymerase